jgi:hypothetical protein
MQIGRPIVYDHVKREVVDDAAANRQLVRAYRGPWKHPGIA